MCRAARYIPLSPVVAAIGHDDHMVQLERLDRCQNGDMERATNALNDLAHLASRHLVALTAASFVVVVAIALVVGAGGATAVPLAGVLVAALGLVVAYSERTIALADSLQAKRLQAYPDILGAANALIMQAAHLGSVSTDASGDLDLAARQRLNVELHGLHDALFTLGQRHALLYSKQTAAALERLNSEYYDFVAVWPAGEEVRRLREPNITGEPWFDLVGSSTDVLATMRSELGVDRLSDELVTRLSAPRRP